MGWQYIDPMTLCCVCGQWQSHTVCEDCIATLAQPRPRCVRCALPLDDPAPCACALAPNPSTALDRCVAAVDYDHPWSHLVARLKFANDIGLARALALLMRHAPWAEPLLEAADRVLPLPLSAQRLQERGYNQALELARHLCPSHKLDLHSLQRLPSEAHQVGATLTQRQAQVAHSFWLHPEAVTALRGQRVLLIDDVMTTGATLHAAARVLRQAGVASVSALVLARTPAPRREPVPV